MGQGNKNKKRTVRESAPALLQRVDIISNENKSTSVSVLQGTVRVLYWESILADTVSASIVFTDAGNTMTRTKKGQGHGKRRKKVSAVEGLPIIGQEKVALKFTDNNDNTMDFDKSLCINKITALPTDSQTTTKSYMFDLVSNEFLDNEKVRVRVCKRGEISDHVKFMLEDVLETEKKIDLDDTSSPLDWSGHNNKPFYSINKLSTKAVSAQNQGLGESAGYFFWETSEGYHFKSIDTLMSQEHKIKIIYNETSALIPVGYNVKALSLETNNKVNVKRKKQAGAYSSSFKALDLYNLKLTNNELSGEKNAESSEVKLAGEKLPTIKSSFDGEGKADSNHTRNIWQFITTGQRHFGPIDQQLSESKEINFDVKGVFTQSLMRYNQLFASEVTVVIPGDFSLHAGDAVWVDIPQTDVTENKACGDEVDKETGGKYLIVDLCHYITAKDTYSKLVLIRDSFGRKGNPSKGSENANKGMSLGDGAGFL